MRLTIFSVSMADYTTYKCVAKNPRGETDGSIRLYGKFNIIFIPCLRGPIVLYTKVMRGYERFSTEVWSFLGVTEYEWSEREKKKTLLLCCACIMESQKNIESSTHGCGTTAFNLQLICCLNEVQMCVIGSMNILCMVYRLQA